MEGVRMKLLSIILGSCAATQSTLDSHEDCLSQYPARAATFTLYEGFGGWVGEGRGLLAEKAAGADVGLETLFNEIYAQNLWRWKGGVGSGVGSDFASVGPVWCALEQVVARFHIESIFDAGVGDFRWMRYFLEATPSVRVFVGVDVSSTLIQTLKHIFDADIRAGRYEFRSTDLACQHSSMQVSVDLIVLRDVLQHHTLRKAAQILRCLDRSGAGLLLVSSYEAGDVNRDLHHFNAALSSSHIALRHPPFSLPEPVATFQEYTHEESKSLLLYKLPIGVEDFIHHSLFEASIDEL